jgi:hypothetical protein
MNDDDEKIFNISVRFSKNSKLLESAVTARDKGEINARYKQNF